LTFINTTIKVTIVILIVAKKAVGKGKKAGHSQEMDLSRYDASAFDRGAPFWKEALWRVCQGLFFQPLWFIPSGLRVFWLRCFGAEIGERVIIRAGVNIHFPWRLKLGDDVWLGEEVMILTLDRVTIDSNVCISQRTFLCTGSHDSRKESFDLITRPIHVEEGCWIAAQSFVGPGVVIGRGSVVSAGSVVLRTVQPGQKVQGNPASAVDRNAAVQA
jgi:putative colanic acid biosynthesis acetyltransferase WcaF